MHASLQDRWLVGFAAALAAASLAWFGFSSPRSGVQAAAPLLSTVKYAPAPVTPGVIKPEAWSAPPAQRHGREWVYEVFTPPEIFYNARTKQFSITAPDSAAEEEPKAPPFGLELVRVERRLYPLQLVGFTGEPGRFQGIFENVGTAETFLAAAGREVPDLGLTIVSVDVRRTPMELPDSTTTAPRTACAEIHDTRSGETVVLSSAERRYTAAPVAFVAPAGALDELHEVREGETISLNRASYTIDRIQLNPAVVEVTKTAAGLAAPDRQTLTPPTDRAPDSALPSNS